MLVGFWPGVTLWLDGWRQAERRWTSNCRCSHFPSERRILPTVRQRAEGRLSFYFKLCVCVWARARALRSVPWLTCLLLSGRVCACFAHRDSCAVCEWHLRVREGATRGTVGLTGGSLFTGFMFTLVFGSLFGLSAAFQKTAFSHHFVAQTAQF